MVFEWLINFPIAFLDVVEEILDFFFKPINEIAHDIMASGPTLWDDIFATPLLWVDNILKVFYPNADISLLSLMLTFGLPLILILTFVKWVIGIIT